MKPKKPVPRGRNGGRKPLPPHRARVTLNTRITRETQQRIDALCAERGQSVGRLIDDAVFVLSITPDLQTITRTPITRTKSVTATPAAD